MKASLQGRGAVPITKHDPHPQLLNEHDERCQNAWVDTRAGANTRLKVHIANGKFPSLEANPKDNKAFALIHMCVELAGLEVAPGQRSKATRTASRRR